MKSLFHFEKGDLPIMAGILIVTALSALLPQGVWSKVLLSFLMICISTVAIFFVFWIILRIIFQKIQAKRME